MNAPSEDPLFRQLAQLASATPDATHSAAVRARCHAAIARQRRTNAVGGEANAPRRQFALAGAGGFAMAYALVVIHDALLTYGFLPPAP